MQHIPSKMNGFYMENVYSSCFLHNVYYFRSILDPARPEKDNRLQRLFSNHLGFGQNLSEFSFNQNISCHNLCNGTFMRLNACSVLKLKAWIVAPSSKTVTKVVKYAARILCVPIAALIDLVVNANLQLMKLAAYPFLYYAVANDSSSKLSLNKNIDSQDEAVLHSVYSLILAVCDTITLGVTPPKMTMPWKYPVFHYQGQAPFTHPSGIDHRMLSRQYASWFQGTREYLPDTDRIQYLRDHCGWNDASVEEILSRDDGKIGLLKEVAYREFEGGAQLVLKGKKLFSTPDIYPIRTVECSR